MNIIIGLLRTLEAITRPPRMGHDVDVPDGAAQLTEREAETECLVPEDFKAVCRCVACIAEERAAEDELAADDDDEPPPYFDPCPKCGAMLRAWEVPASHICIRNAEPGLTPDELVGVRGLPQERYNPNFAGAAASLAGGVSHNQPVREDKQQDEVTCLASVKSPADPHKSSAPSPTIVQSAPPPTVDGEGSPADSGIPPPPAGERPTSELLTRAAAVIDISAGFASALGYCNEATGTELDVFSAELRDRAATFEAIED